jgi:hypothetical protein
MWFLVILAAIPCLGFARPAAAQQKFTDNGRVVVGAERITGLFFENISVKSTSTFDDGMGGTTTTESEAEANTTTFALFGTATGFFGTEEATAGLTSMQPRLAVDVFVASGFSVGGALTYVHSSGTTEVRSEGDPADEEDQPSIDGVVFAPRVGFAVPLSPAFAIWPRAGITHSVYWVSEENDVGGGETVTTKQTLFFTDLTLEGMIAATPVPNVAIIFGPYLDLGLAGGVTTETQPDQTPSGFETDTDWNYTSYGLTAGIAVVF